MYIDNDYDTDAVLKLAKESKQFIMDGEDTLIPLTGLILFEYTPSTTYVCAYRDTDSSFGAYILDIDKEGRLFESRPAGLMIYANVFKNRKTACRHAQYGGIGSRKCKYSPPY